MTAGNLQKKAAHGVGGGEFWSCIDGGVRNRRDIQPIANICKGLELTVCDRHMTLTIERMSQ
jgi:hypothetical protein